MSTVVAFSQWLIRLLEKEKPEHIACFFDESLTSCFRHEIDPGYKSNRTLPDDALSYELLACKKVAELLGISCYASERFEADDLMASASRYCYDSGFEPVLITRDKDLAQILRQDSGLFWDYGYDDAIAYDSFYREFGIAPKYIADFLAIAGDSADAIVGVKGVGKKTVSALFEHFDGWLELKENLDAIAGLPIRGAVSVAKKMKDAVDIVEHNLKLTRLDADCIADSDIKLQRTPSDQTSLVLLFNEFNAERVSRRFQSYE